MNVFTGIFAWLIAAGAFAAGRGYVKTARAMPTWPYTAGTVTTRELGKITSLEGPSVSYYPKPTYTYVVGDQAYTADAYQYAHHGKRQDAAQKLLDAVPETVQVHYNPDKPSEAYLVKHTPRVGYLLYAVAAFVWLVGLAFIVS